MPLSMGRRRRPRCLAPARSLHHGATATPTPLAEQRHPPRLTLTDNLRPRYRVGMTIMANLGIRSRKPPKDEATRRLVLAVALASAMTVVGVIIAGLPLPPASKTTLDEH